MEVRGFDRIARLYQWMEYLSFGSALEHCRFAHLVGMQTARRALVLGDGDGRFTARLLAVNPHVQVVAVDSSPAMLRLLVKRAGHLRAGGRLKVIDAEAVSLLADQPGDVGHSLTPGKQPEALLPQEGFDLVVSHFFLDCLSTDQVTRLAHGVRPRLAPSAMWVISEFATPTPWAQTVVRLLYWGFRLLAGLAVQELPDYAGALRAAGFARHMERQILRGLLVSSIWELQPDS